MGRNGGMRQDEVLRGERGSEALDYLQKRIVIRDEDLNVIAHFRDFGGSAHEVWNGTGRSIPHENLESFSTKIFRDPAADDAQADYSDILARAASL